MGTKLKLLKLPSILKSPHRKLMLNVQHIKCVRTITGVGRIFVEDTLKNTLLKGVYFLIQNFIKRNVKFTIFQNDDDRDLFLKMNITDKTKCSVIKGSGINIKEYSNHNKSSDIPSGLEFDIEEQQLTCIMVSRIVKVKYNICFIL